MPTSITRSFIALVIVLLLGACQPLQPLPDGVSYQGKPHPAEKVQFIADLTYLNTKGRRESEQHIFNEVFNMIRDARQFILLDMFLYNDFQGKKPETTRALSQELTNTLISQKRRYPNIKIIVITDPINTVYGGMHSTQFEQLKSAGIQVVITDLDKLPDSNLVYSTFWRLFIEPFGNSENGFLPSPFGKGKVSLRSYLRLINFKANHRKLIITDKGSDFDALVTSANPHDGSSAHTNTAIKFNGNAVIDLLMSEIAVMAFSGASIPKITITKKQQTATTRVQVLTEGKIKQAVLKAIDATKAGDKIDLSMFYISRRDVINALKRAHHRGVKLRILLDPNKDAFGIDKNGIPNRQVAYEFRHIGIPVRWCDTHGEQCHTKMLINNYQSGSSTIILGSANFTRRNLDDFNLETDVAVYGPQSDAFFRQAQHYFDRVWHNVPGKTYSTDYKKYQDKSLTKRWLYRFMEFTGISTF